MKLLPEWTTFPNVDLTEDEKKKFLEYCEYMKIKCACDEVPEDYGNPFCELCCKIVRGFRGCPRILIKENSGFTFYISIRLMLTSPYYKRICSEMQVAQSKLELGSAGGLTSV